MTNKPKKTITICLRVEDDLLARLKAKARLNGLPYQTFLKLLLTKSLEKDIKLS